MRTCSTCHEEKQPSEFYHKVGARDGRTARCKSCLKTINNAHYHQTQKHSLVYKAIARNVGRRWYSENRERSKAKHHETHLEQRRQCIEAYGGACQCCGEARYEFLAIDHINGGGRKHRQEVGGKICRWLVANEFPPGFRILCHNCNMAIAFYGECPHKHTQRSVG